MSAVLLNPNGINKTIEISVIKDGEINTADIVVGSKIEMKGELTFRKRDDNLYFNFSASEVNTNPSFTDESIQGELTMKGMAGKSIEQKTTKSGKNMLIFSAYSGEKTDNGFAFTWVHFVQFDATKPDWLQAKSTLEAKGELELSIFNDRLNLGCKLAKVKPWDKPVYVPREVQMKQQNASEEQPF